MASPRRRRSRPGCLAGITREHVLAAGSGRAAAVARRLRDAEEAFLTSSTREVQPLVAVDGSAVGDGRPGPVTRQFAAAYADAVRAALDL